MNDGLREALRYAGLGILPPAIDSSYKKRWLKAIVRVQRNNGYTGYCIADNDGADKPRIVCDFCPTGIIAGVLTVHPYSETERNIIPRFYSDEQRRDFLWKGGFKYSEIDPLFSKEGKTPEQIKADREVINSYIEKAAIEHTQLLEKMKQACRPNVRPMPKAKDKDTAKKKDGRTAKSKTTRGKSED